MSVTMLASAGRLLARLIERNGIAPDGIFLACGLDPLKLRNPRARYPVDSFHAAWRLADSQIQTPCWGLQAGEVWCPTDIHTLGYAFLASRTLRAALHRLLRYYAIVVQDIRIRIEETDSALIVSYAIPDSTQDIAALQNARGSVLLRMCRDAYGQRLRFQEAAFTHPCRPCSYEEFFGCPVRYEAPVNSVAFPRHVVERYLPAENLDLSRETNSYLHELARSTGDASVAERVRRAVLDELPSGRPTAAVVGRALALRPRTLQHKLNAEGTTFQAVVEDVRTELGQRYVRSGEYDLLEVTYLLGFSSLPAFSHAYKTWTGKAPSEDLPQN